MEKYENVFKEALALEPELIKIRRQLHQNPETGFELEVTKNYVYKELSSMGYTPSWCGQAGVVATIGNGQGPTFLLRADMDALPITEETGLEFASKNDKMHACGHDFHTTMLLGTAKLLKKYQAKLNGTIKLMFQPAEEIMEGAADMIKSGVLENPKVDGGMMIHVLPGAPIPDGTVLIAKAGKGLSSCDWFEIKIKGKSGHGSTPKNAIDPIAPAAAIYQGLMEIQAREISADALVALTIGEFHSGSTSNVIPDTAVLRGTLRTYDDQLRSEMKIRMQELVEGLAKAYRCEGEMNFLAGAPTLENAEEVVAHANNYLPKYLAADKVLSISDLPINEVQMGSEDFAYVSHEIPVVMLALAAADSRNSEPYPIHHPKLVLNEEALKYGVTAYTAMALSWLEKE